MTHTYQLSLVAFSILVGIFSSFTTLRLASRLAWASPVALRYWILGGACAMGIGIWAMHFIGMLAFHLPIPVGYDLGITAFSVVPAVLASAIALYVLRHPQPSRRTRFTASLLMGLGMTTMHYSGMSAMRMSPPIQYDPLVFLVSILIAVGASWGALNLIFRERGSDVRASGANWRRLGSSVVMGLAIAGMHYTGMAAAQFSPDALCLAAASGVSAPNLALFVGLGASLVLAVSLGVTALDAIVGRSGFYKTLLAAQSDVGEGVFVLEQSRIIYVNPAMCALTGFTEQELVGRSTFLDVFSEPSRKSVRYRLDRVARGDVGAARQQVQLLTQSGELRECELAITAFLHGEKTRFLALCIDISERNRVEQALRAREGDARELALVASLTDNAVIITDAQGLITWVNAGFEKITGYSSSEVRGLRPGALLQGPDTDPAARNLFRERLTRGEGCEVEIINYHKSGRKYWIAIDLQPVRDESGQLVKFIAIERDITEKKLAEQALRAREAEASELALVASRTDNGVIIMNGKAHITWVNEGFVRMSGYSLDEVLGRRPGDFLNGEDTDPATLAFIQEQLANGERFETEIVHYKKSGSKYWAVIDVQAVLDETGAVVKYISIERDITSRKEADAALRQSEMRLNEAQHLAHIGSWEHDLASNEYIMSDEAFRIHELVAPTGRLSRDAVAAAMHPDDLSILRQHRSSALAALGDYSLQLRLVFPQGRLKHVHIRGAVHADERGNPVRVIGTVQDITEQKLAEQALLSLNETLEERVLERTHELDQQRAFIETILDTAETLIFVIDSGGRFVRFNGACERLMGYGFEELRNQPVWECVIPPERKAEVRARYENPMAPQKLPAAQEVEWITRSGQRRLISWANANISDEDGQLMYMVGTGIDITERKRAERALIEANQNLNETIGRLRDTQSQLVQSEKMASLGGLVAGISHEINTPIGIGVTSATALQEEFAALRMDLDAGSLKRSTLDRFIAQGQMGYDILVSNLLRAAELIRNFKQVAVDQSSDEWRFLNLHDYIDEIVLSLKPKLKGRPLQVINASEPNLTIHTHPGAIYQVLSNLLINALTHAYASDQAGVIRITAEQTGNEIQIDFADDGKGIAQDIQGRIFDPFFTTRRGAGGTGLGLHIVFNLVASTLNGVIYLVQNAAGGATFRIRFPLKSENEQL